MSAEGPESVLDVVRRVLRDECAVDAPITPDTHLTRDLALESIGQLTLLVELENHYRRTLEDTPDDPPETVGDVVRMVRAALGAPDAAVEDRP